MLGHAGKPVGQVLPHLRIVEHVEDLLSHRRVLEHLLRHLHQLGVVHHLGDRVGVHVAHVSQVSQVAEIEAAERVGGLSLLGGILTLLLPLRLLEPGLLGLVGLRCAFLFFDLDEVHGVSGLESQIGEEHVVLFEDLSLVDEFHFGDGDLALLLNFVLEREKFVL